MTVTWPCELAEEVEEKAGVVEAIKPLDTLVLEDRVLGVLRGPVKSVRVPSDSCHGQ